VIEAVLKRIREINQQTRIEFIFFMDFSALLLTLFLGTFLVSVTGYSFYVGFGPQSDGLRDPFLEHED